MATHLSILLPLLALANVPQAAADYLNYYTRGFGGYAQAFDERVGPFDANSTEFLRLIDASNATGVFKIPGYDVSKPYSDTPMDGWTLKLAAIDISHVAQEWYVNGVLTSDAMVGYSLTIQAPDALIKTNPADSRTKIVNTDSTWGMCMWNFGHPSHSNHSKYNNPTGKALAEDGSCKGFLSDECIAALEKGTKFAYTDTKKGRYGSPLVCQSLSTPDECGPYGPGNAGSSLPSYGGVPIPYLNGSVTATDGWEFQKDAGRGYNSTKDLQNFWDSMVVNYWVVLTAFINVTADSNTTSSYDRNYTPLSRVSCVAPNGMGTGKAFTFSGVTGANVMTGGGGEGNGTKGDGTKGGDGKDSGAGLVSPARWAVWATLVLGFVLGSKAL